MRIHCPLIGFLAGTIACPAIAANSAASIPDLTGYWGRNVLNLDPPPSGPGPIANTIKRANGTIDDSAYRVGDFNSPILKPEAAKILKEHGELSLGGRSIPDPHNQCWPEPPPFTISIQFGMQLLQNKDEVLLLYEADHNVRRIRMNARHPAKPAPSWQGDSVGHYEGDALVIDTVGIKAGPLAVLDRYGTPFSEKLHVVERYRLISGEEAAGALNKRRRAYGDNGPQGRFDPYGSEFDTDPQKTALQGEITVDDPGTFTMPWKGVVTYLRGVGNWPEMVCAENLREANGPEKQVPMAAKPDF